MKTLILESLELLSLTERRARKVKFHPRLTLITGVNGAGKSSIIKSIYWVFGASSAKIHPNWVKAQVKGLATFTIDGIRFRILRSQDQITVFDSDDIVLISTSSLTKELGPFLSKLLNFKLMFVNRKTGEPEIPPPAYAFLPFYVDQDAGWSSPLTSFDRLSQYPRYKKAVVEFHSGIRPNQYYELESTKKKFDLEIRDMQNDQAVVRKAAERLVSKAPFSGIETSAHDHEVSIQKLLLKLKNLHDIRHARAVELTDILDQKTQLEAQAAIVDAAANELAKDAEWIASDERRSISCPLCGTPHNNNFKNRFAILADRAECISFLGEARNKLHSLADRAKNTQNLLSSTEREIDEIDIILRSSSKEVTFKDFIDSEGRRIATGIFSDQDAELELSISGRFTEISSINKELRKLNKASRKDVIEKYYSGLMISNLIDLNVTAPDIEVISKINSKLVETGSEQPRLLLAYVMALADTINKYTTSFTAPLVIDSPVQQEQDTVNAPAIIKRVIAERPNGGQCVVGTISLHGVEVSNGDIITLRGKKSALLAEEFDSVYFAMAPYLSGI